MTAIVVSVVMIASFFEGVVENYLDTDNFSQVIEEIVVIFNIVGDQDNTLNFTVFE